VSRELIRAGLIYGGGDTLAVLLLGTFSPWRVLGVTLVGTLVYAPEIRRYFGWLARCFAGRDGRGERWRRAVLAWLWFNPLWIARHGLVIRLCSGRYDEIGIGLLTMGLSSFCLGAPVALLANYAIQHRIAEPWRVTASASYSALMAIYYAASEVWFG
jgi:hypothetical protein